MAINYRSVLGSTGLEQYSGNINEEWHRELRGDRGRKTYREMAEQDPSCGAVLGLVRAWTLGCETHCEPSDDTPEAREVCEWIDAARYRMKTTWSQHWSEALSALVYGWSVFEVVLKVDDDGQLIWDNIEIRGQETLDKWEFGDHGEILGMRQDLGTGQRVLLPAEKCVHYRVNVSKNNPEGRSLLRAAYRPYFFLKRIQETEAVGIENDASGIPYLQVPPALLDSSSDKYDSTIVSDLEKKVVQIAKGTRRGLVIGAEVTKDGPTGWKLDTLRGGGRPMYDTNIIILRYRSEIVNAILNAGFIYLGQEQHGSFSLSDSKTNTFAQALSGILDDFCETFTRQAIEPLCRLNGIPEELWPYLVHGDIETPPLTEIANYVQALVGVGAMARTPKLEERLREIAKLPLEPVESEAEMAATFEPQEGEQP